MILRHMNEQRAVESRTVRAGDGRSRNVVIRDQFIIEDCKHSFPAQPHPKPSDWGPFLIRERSGRDASTRQNRHAR